MSTATLNIEMTQAAGELSEAKRTLVPQLRFQEFDGEWKLKTLSEVANKITDGTHDTPKPTKEGVPFLTAIHIKDGFVDYNNCYYLDQVVHNSIYKRCNPEKDDLLIVNIGAGTATCAVNSVDYEFSLKNVALVKPNKELINGKFLAQIQRKKAFKIFNQLTSGGAQPFLSLKEIGRLKIIHPTLLEQQKIASFLSAVDEKIQQLSRKKELLAQYKKGVMQQLFSGKLRFKDENGQDYADWEEKKLGDIASLLKDGSHGSHKDVPDGKHYLLSAKNIRNGRINFDDNDRKISEDDFKSIYRNYSLEENDILLTIVGTIGRVAKYKGETNISFQRSVAFFRFKNIFSDYIFQLMNGDTFQKELDTRKVVSAQPGIYLGDLAKIALKIPCIEEQQKIANFLSGIDGKIEQVNGELVKTQEFKKGLLQQLFV